MGRPGSRRSVKQPRKVLSMSDPELSELRAQAAQGDPDAVAQLVEFAAEREDVDELRQLANAGSTDAVDELIELAAANGDLDELRRLAAGGSRDAADVLQELEEERAPDDDE
jgi:hypothetical protein